jgi:hypothetical protein
MRYSHASRCGSTFAFATAYFLPIYNLNCSAWERASDLGLQKRATFSTLIIGPARTGKRKEALKIWKVAKKEPNSQKCCSSFCLEVCTMCIHCSCTLQGKRSHHKWRPTLLLNNHWVCWGSIIIMTPKKYIQIISWPLRVGIVICVISTLADFLHVSTPRSTKLVAKQGRNSPIFKNYS